MQVSNEYQKGEEVFNNYGKRPNSNLLQLYGFVINGNPDNDVHLDVQLIPDKYQEYKERALLMHKLNG